MSGNISESSGLITSSSQVLVGPGRLHSVSVDSPTANDGLYTIYDSENSTTTGKTVLAQVECHVSTGTQFQGFEAPVVVNRGIYVVVGGTSPAGSSAIVRFSRE